MKPTSIARRAQAALDARPQKIPGALSVATLIERADAILRRAHCDVVTGASKDRQYHRAAHAKAKRFSAHRRARNKRLGKFGAASPVRHIAPDGR